jgi:hypothetical protein
MGVPCVGMDGWKDRGGPDRVWRIGFRAVAVPAVARFASCGRPPSFARQLCLRVGPET